LSGATVTITLSATATLAGHVAYFDSDTGWPVAGVGARQDEPAQHRPRHGMDFGATATTTQADELLVGVAYSGGAINGGTSTASLRLDGGERAGPHAQRLRARHRVAEGHCDGRLRGDRHVVGGRDRGLLHRDLQDGSGASLVTDRALNAAPGAYLITGVAASTVVGRVLNAAPGVYLITGVDAGLVYTPVGAYILTADPGTYTLTGVASSPVAGRVVNAVPGSYTLTGVGASLLAVRLIAVLPGSYLIVGADATIAGTLTVVAGSVTVTDTTGVGVTVADVLSSAAVGVTDTSGVTVTVTDSPGAQATVTDPERPSVAVVDVVP
jgi:hypothetical protein